MTIFYEGSLQEGIALAVREAKAVVCFVRDDAQLSSTWEEEFFSDNEVVQALGDKSVLLRLTAGTQEAGFLSSFCPIAEFPALIVIKNGKMEEYLLPGVSKDEFKSRIIAVLGEQKAYTPVPAQRLQASIPAVNTNSSSSDQATIPLAPISAPAYRRPSQSTSAPQRPQESAKPTKQPAKQETAKPTPPKPQPVRQDKGKTPAHVLEKTATTSQKSTKPAIRKPPAPTVEDEEPKPQPPAPKGPPSQYRLQVRLFDGRSIRSSFTPTQTIRKDVRPWLDEQMTEDKRPYNLKHILTPLPSRTLSVAEESQALQEIGLDSTATLVMVPVASYTEAYTSAAASLPARGISAVYNVVSSVASSATSLVGSFIGYGSSAPESSPQPSPPSPPPSENTRRPRTGGLNIRTLRDQQNERDDSQFYNGNQLNFEPRDQNRKDD
ncbi:uncharacterized protein N7496_005149 [Penicillium cataractarum]|uniref:UBX domain-containing protein 2 n=1 Tax=Penicillium cataractarum TaxID=2100454 RepID=A0A9W9VFN0_9EURO|nr:uncharacterized protein N7496_005149 [Penicillium cataractarum]KAJ5377740.1 hypothetical protein N7496_005149 [Penicillium cataractarum]